MTTSMTVLLWLAVYAGLLLGWVFLVGLVKSRHPQAIVREKREGQLFFFIHSVIGWLMLGLAVMLLWSGGGR